MATRAYQEHAAQFDLETGLDEDTDTYADHSSDHNSHGTTTMVQGSRFKYLRYITPGWTR